ncbi:MAG: DUF2818 family protein [Janthinobacterium lividum]
MDLTAAVWLVILLALFGANLPFLNERLFGLFKLPSQHKGGVNGSAGDQYLFLPKPFWLRAIEMLVLYSLVGLLAWVIESRMGNAFTQHWEFFASTGCLFIVAAYPGFIWRYLRKQRSS